MQTTTVKLYTLPYSNVRTYLAVSLFVLGNLAMPQLFHLIPQGGMVWLPIYFFTLVGAYKYGWMVGLLTAVLSPMATLFCSECPLWLYCPPSCSNPFCWLCQPGMRLHISGKPRLDSLLG